MPDDKPVILIVEDDRNDQELAQLAFAKSGVDHELRISDDGIQVLELLIGNGALKPLPHLLLLDLKLPKLSGAEVLAQLRADRRTKSLPILIFTSSLEERDIKTCQDLGANGYVRKPNEFADYKATIADIARFWLLRNQTCAERLV